MASQDARLSKFKANFKRQQGEMTNKIDIVLKAITDQIVGTLPSDTVKNPKLGTYPVLSACYYPIMDPQCSTQIHSSINIITIHLKQPDESQVNKLEVEQVEDNPGETNSSPHPQPDLLASIATKQIIRDDDEPQNEDPNKGEGATTKETVVEYFDTFPTRNELTYHRYLMSGPIPSIFLRNPIITEGCPYNLKISCNIEHVHIEKAYIDLNSPLNIMTRMMYNWIMRRNLDPREDANGGISNFTGRIKGMHVFIGNFTYVVDFIIVEDISSIIDHRESRDVSTLSGLRNAETVNATHFIHLFWPTIGDGGYNVGNTKAKSIRNPRIKLAHRCITMTITGRKKPPIVSLKLTCSISIASLGKGLFITRSLGFLTNELVSVLNREPLLHVYRKTLLIKMRVIMELQEGKCCWPATRGVSGEGRGDDEEGDEERGNDGIGGSADIYCSMSQGKWQVHQT
ncbi:hypothetical protein Tco_0698408 [Tanacetum coccineum]